MQPAESNADNLEQSQESAERPFRLPKAELATVAALAAPLIAELGKSDDGKLVGEMVENALKLLRDQTNRGDVKLINKALKELRYALKVFAPYREVRKVSMFGSARTPETDPDYRQAEIFGQGMAKRGWMVITGAGGGIMAAGHGGAGADPSFGLAIRLPFEQATNRFIANDPKLINFKYFFTRKLMFVRSSHAIALFPGGFGTMDEGFEALTLIQTGKSAPMPVVLVDRPGGEYWRQWDHYVQKQLLGRGLINPEDRCLYKITDNTTAAIEEICGFYSNFHSVRYHRQEIIIRLQRAPGKDQLSELSRRFDDIKVAGQFRVSGPLAVEKDEPSLDSLPRLVFHFNTREQSRLRMLIDWLNQNG